MASRPSGASPAPLSSHGDRYFDGLAEKFAASLYGHPRGELRLVLLDHLLPELLDLHQQPVLDVGAGLGQMGLWFARRGHPVTLCEPAAEMLDEARQVLADDALARTPRFLPLPLQALPEQASGPWSLIVCHAVLEWMGDPRRALHTLSGLLAPGGQLSLMVFNRDALRLSNIVKGNLDKALADRLAGTGQRQRLTPISPIAHADVVAWAEECGLGVEGVAGIRVFHDYLLQRNPDPETLAKLTALELRHCRDDAYWRLGRYLLYTLRKPEEPVL
ncbi:S-adenosylmethionine-dependent methyltransferase [Franzmannia pantelleriensis]|uniref:tRNA 5-carboxymethoxyuridine methyltransferase n=1 Tax=Franzmannia pantelleriensis TaxID=48727 RepID=A0A1G9GTZ2_9GAMM|nr:methyltransferase domain-containing protein [Halomonas pantelleriensis]SDL04015.1 S-adenosylmethionine-dependent methyltransferase [Halomonas pantelleriensis]